MGQPAVSELCGLPRIGSLMGGRFRACLRAELADFTLGLKDACNEHDLATVPAFIIKRLSSTSSAPGADSPPVITIVADELLKAVLLADSDQYEAVLFESFFQNHSVLSGKCRARVIDHLMVLCTNAGDAFGGAYGAAGSMAKSLASDANCAQLFGAVPAGENIVLRVRAKTGYPALIQRYPTKGHL